MTKFSLTDQKIMYELDGNARLSYSQIAKKTRISKDTVRYRIMRLQEKGIIERFDTTINVGKLGLTVFRIYLKLRKKSRKKEKEIIDYLKEQENVSWLISLEGDYDIGAWVTVKEISEMNKLWKNIRKEFNSSLEKKNMEIITRITYFRRSNPKSKSKDPEARTLLTTPDTVVQFDNHDIEILDIMGDDARVPVLKISENIGLTPKTVLSKIRKMEKNGIIAGYRVRYYLDKFDTQYFKVRFNLESASEKREKELRNYFNLKPYIDYEKEILGGDDIEIELSVKNSDELRKIVDDILDKFEDIIKNYTAHEFYKEHKYESSPTKILKNK